MEIIKTDIEDVLILKPKVYGDKRGYFMESFEHLISDASLFAEQTCDGKVERRRMAVRL